MPTVIESIKKDAQKYFKGSCPSHDWSHVERVYNLCVHIGEKENANLFILQTATLLHDTGRKQEIENPSSLEHAKGSKVIAEDILCKYNIIGAKAENILHCIEAHRFRNNIKPVTLEAKVLFDADKLDSIGAIGVIRAYSWVGTQKIKLYSDKDYLGTGYEQEHSPVTEFEHKLKKVKDTLFTETAKKMALRRHNFMVNFFKELEMELNQ